MARILVVNDEPGILQLFCQLLAMHRHQPIPASNSARGVELLRHAKPDLVIVDILDPPVGGLEVIRMAKWLYPELPVFVESGYWDWYHVMEAVMMGASYYLPIPFDIDVFIEAVDHTIHRPMQPPVSPLLEWADRHADSQTSFFLNRVLEVGLRSRGKWTELHTAAVWGHTERAAQLIAQGADVNAQSLLGMAPLHWACRNRHRDTAELLLTNGANAMVRDALGRRPVVELVVKSAKA